MHSVLIDTSSANNSFLEEGGKKIPWFTLIGQLRNAELPYFSQRMGKFESVYLNFNLKFYETIMVLRS